MSTSQCQRKNIVAMMMLSTKKAMSGQVRR
jgi:hypothetical protein